LSEWQVIKAVKAENDHGGVKIMAKDLRDVFATVVIDNVRNPIRRADSHAAYFGWGQVWGQLPT